MRKGFTLVELLAVIIVVAVISLITIPMITDVLEKSKIDAFKESANGLVTSARYYTIGESDLYTTIFLFDEERNGESLYGQKLDFKNGFDVDGKLVIDQEGSVSLCIYNDKYYAYKTYNGTVVVGNIADNNCEISQDPISGKWIAALQGSGNISDIYSREEVDILLDELEIYIANNKNEIHALNTEIEQLDFSNLALKEQLTIESNKINSISSIISSNSSRLDQLEEDYK